MRTRRISRREFLQAASAGCGILAVSLQARGAVAGWDSVAQILGRIRPPVFPQRDFDITRHGAAGDGITDCSEAMRKAIDACTRSGGGRVVVPAGDFLTGPIHLRSNVNLHLSEGARLRFIQDPDRYLPAVYTRWEGVECMGYSSFIYAFQQENIAVTGPGILDGQADNEHWWQWTGSPLSGGSREKPNQMAARSRLFKMGEDDTPVNQRIFGARKLPAAKFSPVLPLQKHTPGRRDGAQLPDVADSSRPVYKCDRPGCFDDQPRPQQRRLQSGIKP